LNMSMRQSIDHDGFAVVASVFSHDAMIGISREITESSAGRSRAGIRHGLRLAPVAKMAGDRVLIDLARSLLGATAFPFRATLFDKSATANWLVAWHQDTALPLCQRIECPGWGPWSVKAGIVYAHAPAPALSQVLALRLHLDDSTPGNGPLRVLPATHTLGVLSADRIHDLTNEISPMDCVCPKGGVVLMKPLLVHASSKSQIDAPRRVLHIEYAASESVPSPLRLATA
jgi:ectoine hydroxylase-related dioxygenase (phytanoyl-CoA dioxygenase family)